MRGLAALPFKLSKYDMPDFPVNGQGERSLEGVLREVFGFESFRGEQLAIIEHVIAGGDAVVLVDGLDGLHPHTARKALAAARNLTDGGSLTVIATAARPFGGESTVIALDVARTSIGRLPALDLLNSGTLALNINP